MESKKQDEVYKVLSGIRDVSLLVSIARDISAHEGGNFEEVQLAQIEAVLNIALKKIDEEADRLDSALLLKD